MFWADEVVKRFLDLSQKNNFLISDYKTPSGRIHVGALRGVLIHQVLTQALIELDKKAAFRYGFDDYDPMDALPVYLGEDYEKYMGMPLSNIPSPEPGAKSYGEFYAKEFQQVFEALGVKAEIVWTSKLYKEGEFDKAIKIVLDEVKKIREIYKEVTRTGKSADWYPLQVICPSCGKVGTTKVTGWDGKEVEFICQKDLVAWAKGCGQEGKISPFGGKAKMPWKVEWAAKWFIFGTDIENAGKDHMTRGGSFDVASAIAKEIFKIDPPFAIPYEFFLVAGAKMSSSKGLGVSAKEIAETLPPTLLRFLMIRPRPSKTIDFDPRGITVLTLFDEFDKAAQTYLKDKKTDLSRAFWFSQVFDKFEVPKYLMRFSKIAYLIQMPNVDIKVRAEEEKGAKLTDIEKKELEERIDYAKKWLKVYAPEHFKFEVKKILPAEAGKLTNQQKQFLSQILELIEEKVWKGEDLHHEIHKLRKESGLDPREAFSAIYLIFIGKDSGPQAGWFLASLDRDFVVKRLKEALN